MLQKYLLFISILLIILSKPNLEPQIEEVEEENFEKEKTSFESKREFIKKILDNAEMIMNSETIVPGLLLLNSIVTKYFKNQNDEEWRKEWENERNELSNDIIFKVKISFDKINFKDFLDEDKEKLIY